MSARHYHPRLRFSLIYEDSTPYGSAVSGRCDAELRRRANAVGEMRQQHGMAETVRRSRALLGELFAEGGPFGELYQRPGVLREDCLYPDPSAVRPVGLALMVPGGVEQIAVPPDVLADLAGWIGSFVAGEPRPRNPKVADLYDALERHGMIAAEAPQPALPAAGDMLFVGHAALRVGAGDDGVLFDPFLLPRSERFPATYQPLTPVDLAPVGAIFITHCHPDHYDLASLLAFGPDLPIYVPEVPRESLLSVDMAARLREIGFHKVTTVTPGDSVDIGATRVEVLPLYGEQPTVGRQLHPDVRNVGAIYLARDGRGRSYLLTVDAGRDVGGDVRDLAVEVREKHGAVDVLLGGYRGFGLYPLHYLFSSVARYLLFVPPELWDVRQAIMNNADELIDTAEAAGARLTVPYADGGAPWYWEMGLGPRLDDEGSDNPFVDPPPEAVVAAANARSASREGVFGSIITEALVMRPGETLSFADDGAHRVVAGEQQMWPYGPR